MYNDVQMVEVDVNSYQRSLHIQQYANRDLYVTYRDIHNPIYLRKRVEK
jgi:hypothetical protein